jgi:hypothetical protein
LLSLNLYDNGIGDAGATQLAEGLRVNTTLTSLHMVCNIPLGGDGRRALREACPPQCALSV